MLNDRYQLHYVQLAIDFKPDPDLFLLFLFLFLFSASGDSLFRISSVKKRINRTTKRHFLIRRKKNTQI